MNSSRNSACLYILSKAAGAECALGLVVDFSLDERTERPRCVCTTFGCGWKLNNGAATTGGKSRRRRQRRAGVGYGKLLGRGALFASNKYGGCERASEFGCFSIRAIHNAGQQLPLISLLPAAKLVARARPRRRSQIFLTHTRRKT